MTNTTTTKKYNSRYEALMSKEMGDFLGAALKEAQRREAEKLTKMMEKRNAKRC